MTKQLDVLLAVKAMVADALDAVGNFDVSVEGLDGGDAAPERVGAAGRVVIEAGDPGPPEIDLSPLTYNYQHQIPLQVTTFATDSLTALQVLDAILEAVATGIEQDRQLGGLVDWLDAFAPPTADDEIDGAEVARTADATILASYSTSRPL